MKAHELLDAVGYISEQFIEDAAHTERVARIRRLPAAICAACVCAAVAGLIIAGIALRSYDRIEDTPHTAVSASQTAAEGVTIPKLHIEKPGSEVVMDMIAFFIYNGRCYCECGRYDSGLDLIGEHLGTATGSLDEWSGPDEYVDLSGSIGGDFYSVKGYSPEFMLCMRTSDGNIQVFINDNGITVAKGSDIFEDRFRLSETLSAVRYETNDSWFYGNNEIYRLKDTGSTELKGFIAAVDEGVCELVSEELYNNELSEEHRKWRVYFDSAGGISVGMVVYDNGYVQAVGLGAVCVRADTERIAPFITMLESGGASEFVGQTDSLLPTLEDCRSDPYLGRYVPLSVPGRLELQHAWKSYDIDIETGALIKTRSVSLSYTGEGYCDITVLDPAAFGEEGYDYDAICDIGDLSAEYIRESMRTEDANNKPLKYPQVNLCVRYSGAVVSVCSGGLTPEELYDMLRSAG